jgi:hypothetical protein
MRHRGAVPGLAAILIAACGSSPRAITEADPSVTLEPGGPAETGFVTGSAHWHAGGTAWTTYEIHARLMPDGTVDGTWQSRRHLGPEGGAKRHGRVTCMAFDGNQVWLGGIIEKAINPDFVGDPIGLRLIDNGEGADAAPDQFGATLAVASAEGYCEERPATALAAVEAGNLVVHSR